MLSVLGQSRKPTWELSSLFFILAMVFIEPLGWNSSEAQVSIDFGDDTSNWAHDGECDDPRFMGEVADTLLPIDAYRDATDCSEAHSLGLIRLREQREAFEPIDDAHVEIGSLATGDVTMETGEYVDIFPIHGESGSEIYIDLRSADFDTYLIVQTPQGSQFENDDYLEDTQRSVISFTFSEDGTHNVLITSYAPGETGDYSLHIALPQEENKRVTISESGSLTASDSQLNSGEYADFHEFEIISPGQRLVSSLASENFDAYLAVLGPSGFVVENDDADENTKDSYLEADLPESGDYVAVITSYAPGEIGSYDFELAVSPMVEVAQLERLNAQRISEGTTIGNIQDSDGVVSGKYFDMFSFDATASDRISLELTSSEFDPVLKLRTPDGFEFENDDFEGSLERSRIELDSSRRGRYQVTVTTYDLKATGEYSITLNLGDQGEADTEPVLVGRTPPKVFGLFVGISDYPGTQSDLPLTAVDAELAFASLVSSDLMLETDGITLTDEGATRENFERSIRAIADRASIDDLIVIFFSGHGSRVDTESDSMDPDGLNETLVLYDNEITDDELRTLIREIKGDSKVLLVFDSCFSGGFLKDLISMPGIMGVFSSEENVTSAVAEKFRAGGFLSTFFSDGVKGGADANENGEITALELGHYLSERFRVDVVAEKGPIDPEDFVRVSHNLAYQRLVLDHSAIGPDHVLFRTR